MVMAVGTTQMCYSMNGITYAPFAYYNVKMADMPSLDVGATCLYGDGNIASSFFDPSILTGALDGIPFKKFAGLINTARGVDAAGDKLSANASCGYPFFF